MPTGDPIGQVERISFLLDKGPITTVAAIFILACIVLGTLYIRSQVRIQKLQAAHAKEVKEIYGADRERAIKMETAVSGLLILVEDLEFIAKELRRAKEERRNKKKAAEAAKLALAAKKEGGGGAAP